MSTTQTPGFSPLTGIPWFPTAKYGGICNVTTFKFQSPDGDSVVSHHFPHFILTGDIHIYVSVP